MKKIKKILTSFLAAATAVSFASGVCFAEGALYNYYFSKDVVDIYYIIGLEPQPLACYQQAKENGVRDFILTEEGQAVYEELMAGHQQVKDSIAELIGRTPDVEYDYTAAFNGFSMALSYNELLTVQNNAEALDITSVEVGADVERSSVKNTADESNNSEDELSYSDLTTKILEATGVTESGLEGDGVVIAVIDNEFDTKHEFLSMPDDAQGKLSKEDIKAVYPYLSAAPYVSNKCYINEKIPFAFDYYGYDFNTLNYTISDDSHGTHVAGIAAGNGDAETNAEYDPDGVASNAQLVLLASQNLYDSNIIAAYDDALFLGADVINASYGATYATTLNSVSEYTAISNITGTGTIFCNAAGNSAKNTLIPDLFTDYSTSGIPTNIPNVLAVGSAENLVQAKENGIVILADGSEEAIVNSSDYSISDTYDNMEFEYVEVPGYGEEADYADIDVTDKIVLVKRGVITFEDKSIFAAGAGAVGIIFYNNDDSEAIHPAGTYILPAGMVSYETGMKMIEAENKTLTFGGSVHTIEQSENIIMSDYSSWAFTEQLLLSPDISGFGGDIISSIADGGMSHKSYDVFSGTSMASPQLTGINALLKQYLLQNQEKYGILNRSDYTELSAKLLMSTATPVFTSDSLEIASPRVQGNGIANINSAINTPCYISTDSEKDNYRPKISLGDGYKQSYTLTFNITNVSDTDSTYTPSVQLFKDTENENGELAWNTLRLAENEDYTAVFSDESGKKLEQITVPAGETIKISAAVTMSDEVFSQIQTEGGRFVDGFVRLSSTENPNLTLSFMAFCGNWAQTDEGGLAFDFVYDDMVNTEQGSVLCDYNINFAGYNLFDDTFSKACFSPNGDGIFDSLGLYMMFKRRCYDLTATIYNSDGKQIYTENLGSGANAETNYGLIGSTYEINWDFKENGEIQEDAEYTIEMSARLPLSEEMTVIDSCNFKIDNQAPVVKKVGRLVIDDFEFLIIEAEDNTALQGALSYSNNYGEIMDGKSANCSVSGNRIIVDGTDISSNDCVQIYDTAGNYTVISPDDATYTLTAEYTNSFGYATTDEDTFANDRIAVVDDDYQVVDIDIQFSESPSEVYEMYGSEAAEVTLLIDGFETTYCFVETGILGDANTDGKCNVSDAAYIARMLSNKKTDKYQEFLVSIGGYCADYNKDGAVTVSDAATIARHLASRNK